MIGAITSLILPVKIVTVQIIFTQAVHMRSIRSKERSGVELARTSLKMEASESALDTLITGYIGDKSQLDALKKSVDLTNGRIKDMMAVLGISERVVGNNVAKRVIQVKETLNPERLLDLVKSADLPEEVRSKMIKTQEYVDTDSLEDAIYNGAVTPEFLLSLDSCRETKEVVTLRISKLKERKETE